MEQIISAIKEWEERQLPELKERQLNMNLFTKADHIIDIIGVRRSGKTYLMFLAAKKLLNQFEKPQVIYINFENKTLFPLNDKLLDDLLNYIIEKGLDKRKVFVFLDEVHNIENWEKWARNIYDDYKGRIKLIVSGSTSKLIRKDVATLLTGRHLSNVLMPLSFREYLLFNQIDCSKEDLAYSKRKQLEIKKHFKKYLEFGGFPEAVLMVDRGLKLQILRNYYEDILYKDIVQHFKIKEMNILENLTRFLILNIGRYFSFKRVSDHLNSLNINASTRTLLRYTSMLEEVFLFYFLPIFSFKVKDELKYPRKTYLVDHSLRTVLNPDSADLGSVAENMVFLELKRQSLEKQVTINYWKSRADEEVDFMIRKQRKITELIQVCYDLSNQETKQREIKALLKASKELKCSNLLVITEDYEAEEKVKGKKIRYVPLWKWLLK